MGDKTDKADKIINILSITTAIVLALGKLVQQLAEVYGEFDDADKAKIEQAHQEALNTWKKVYAEIMAQP